MNIINTTCALVLALVSSVALAAGPWPKGIDDIASTQMDTKISITVLDNDLGSNLELTSTNPYSSQGGLVSLGEDKLKIDYHPKAGFTGEDTFWYVFSDDEERGNYAKVTVTITESESVGPPQTIEDTASTKKNGSIEIPVLDNDLGQSIKLTSTNDWTQKGGRSSVSGGSITYEAPKDFIGEDTFWYVMEDSQGRTNSAKVTVTVTADTTNTDTSTDRYTGYPQANVDTSSLERNGDIKIAVLNNDLGQSITLISTNDWTQKGGRSSVDGTNIFYKAPKDYVGEDTFWYVMEDSQGRANSAKVIITIKAPVTAKEKLRNAHRLLLHTTFGPTLSDLNRVQNIEADVWVDEQLNAPSAYDSDTDQHLTHLQRTLQIAEQVEPNTPWYATAVFNQQEADFSVDEYQMATWWENAIGLHPTHTAHGRDQLRQRVAFALSQLLVVSNVEQPLHHRGEGLADYYDMLTRHAFGNYRDLLGEMARSPVMGVYLSHQGNQKANLETGTTPDENFARELMQLFTIGLFELNIDGSPNRDGDPATFPDSGTTQLPSYTEKDVTELSKVMTGWDLVSNDWYGDSFENSGDYTRQMEFTATEHEDEIAEGGDGKVTVVGKTFALNSGEDGSGMDSALDALFQHPNIAPHVSKHLIMRLITSNPTPAYVARVSRVFINNGDGVRGDLKAVIRAILLDDEARNPDPANERFGKIKEPIIAYTQVLRALNTVPLNGWKSEDGETAVSGVYWFKAPNEHFGQGPLRSPSVFNFYAADYVPSDPYFSSRGLVSPEMKILTHQNLHKYNNKLFEITYAYEKNRITGIAEQSLSDFAATKHHGYEILMTSDFNDALVLMRQAAGGSFYNFEPYEATSRPNKAAAVNALISHYDRLLLGGTMDATLRGALSKYLMKSAESDHTNKFKEATLSVKDTVRMITTSSAYMFQR